MIKALVSAAVTGVITGPALRLTRRTVHGLGRRLVGKRPVIEFFHQDADPYSILATHTLSPLSKAYDVDIRIWHVSPPGPRAAPEPERLGAWAARDCLRLAQAHGLDGATGDADFSGLSVETDTGAGDDRLSRLGHYQGAMFWFEGEWYWGLDRLHHLETRLLELGLERTPGQTPLYPVREIALEPPPSGLPRRTLNAFLSLRSPYSYIALPRAKALSDHYGAQLRLRFVLPMVMRGLPVPPAKRRYITLDTRREADRLGLPFGRIVDPVGRGVERGLAVLHHAARQGLDYAFAHSFTRGVWAEGVDAVDDRALKALAARAGLSAAVVEAALQDDSWRTQVEANREEMFADGLWGVPSFRVDDPYTGPGEAVWGQDRLWQIEEDLRRPA